ncbi:MAG: TetR/AcrR family transcriptional regulator [Deltaproteobacteria bacterium]|nr:TetR/AcrR family transcriptional regulator [Deltaproteobacteria bacterium]
MANFREIRFTEKKEEIFNRSAEIFARKGYEKTTLEEIAAELKMTKGSLYYYFKGKEDILFQSLMRAHALANDVLRKIADKTDLSPPEKLTLAIKEHIKVLTRRFVYSTLRQQDLLLPEKWRKALIEERDRFQEMFNCIIQEGVEDGSFKKVNLKMASFIILGSVNWVARWYSPNGEFTAEEIGEAFADYLVGGLLIGQS